MKILDDIKNTEDIKKLNIRGLNALSSDVREFLLNSLSKTGGHLASNLGVVELTVALYKCFNFPKDKVIWDVGHQAYVHKILTGRKNAFNELRKYKGLSGFPKSEESEYDCFDTGHSSTSISAGLGFAVSRDLSGEDYNVISVIGDGSMTGGLAFEALNNAGRSDTNLIVVLNDNEMSISKNVGAVSRHLNHIRTAPTYLGAKKDVNKLLRGMPLLGQTIGSLVERTKDSIKYFFISGVLFEEFGFKYIGPVDGHNMNELITVFEKVKQIEGPVLVHVYTKKGKGYHYAENSPEKFHGVDLFNVQTGKSEKAKSTNTYSDIFGEEIVKIAAKNKKVVAITASMPSGTGLDKLQKIYPERLFDVGIAEAHAVTFAAGMAKNGMVPVFAVYSTFLQRGYDQILHDVCIQNLPVVFAIDRAGIVGQDGETHQGIFDLSYLSHMPNMTIMAPRNGNELREMMNIAVGLGSPVAIRYPKGNDSPILPVLSQPVTIGKSEIINNGDTIAIISVGSMFDSCYNVYTRLKAMDKNPTLINARFVKPLDIDMIKDINSYNHVFIVEENVRSGGFGSSVLEKLSEKRIKTSIHLLALPDEFIEQGTREQLLALYNLDEEGIFNSIIKFVK